MDTWGEGKHDRPHARGDLGEVVLRAPAAEAPRQRHVGAKWIYLRHDLQAALYHMLRRELTPAAWLRSLRGVRRDAVFAWRDPLPFAADLLHATEAALDVVRGRRR